ncbi:putative folate metabolism gamma-glutamate ligase, partial [Candidatus Falkowbacteria bacterium]|nr:putative folate metabolism gamma-glutamate ligase [Candidatus Falkowbacteria bacterium]
MEIRPIKTRVFEVAENLLVFLDQYFLDIKEQSVLVVASKIVALSQGRAVPMVEGSAKEQIIQEESQLAIPTEQVYLTIKDGLFMANAGIDESNADNKMILLPSDSFQSAEMIRNYFQNKYQLKELGVIITDSHCLPLRAGVIAVALGYAGFVGLKDYSGQSDLFGRPFKFSKVDIADSLATAAALCMGEGDESQPLAIISGAPIEYCDKTDKNEL